MDSMDFVGNIHIRCEYCGTEYDHPTHHVVMKNESPDLAQGIIDDEFFYAVCPHCHRMTGVDHPVVYADLAKSAIIAYFDSVIELSLAQKQIEEWVQEFGVDAKRSIVRVVSMQNELREKVILLENGLDDRVVEILKLWALERVREEGHHQEFDEMRCSVLEGGYVNVDFVGSEPMHMRVKRSYYDQMAQSLMPAINQCQTPLEVSTEWAVEFDAQNRQ
jgi:hypothetical protein